MTAALQIGVIALAPLVVVETSRELDRQLALQARAIQIQDAAVSLRYLTQEYALLQRERTRVQWLLRHASLVKLLEGAPLEAESISRLRGHSRILGELFADFSAARAGPAGGARFQAEVRTRLMGQMLNRAEMLHGDAGEVATRSRGRIVEVRRRFYWVVGSLLASVLPLVALAQWLMRRRVIEPLLALRDHAARVGPDNLSERLSSGRHDEIGQLAGAFDAMTSNLQRSMVSRQELIEANGALQGEIRERMEAERRVLAQLRGLKLLQTITRAIADRQDAGSVFQVAVHSLEEALPADFVCIALHDPASGELKVANVSGGRAAPGRELVLEPRAGIPVEASAVLTECMSGHLAYTRDGASVACPLAQRLQRFGLSSSVVAPLAVESGVLGVLAAARSGQDAFSPDECQFVQQLGELVGLAAYQADVHEALRQAYEHLRSTQQAVMQHERLRAIGQMASGIAHDINNAISPVALYTESLLEREPGLSARGREQVTIIQQAIDDVANTVARMREFYRQREVTSQRAAVAVNEVVSQVAVTTEPLWRDIPQRRGIVIHLTCDLAPDLPAIHAAAGELREALTNLIFNAVDALPQGGDIILRTRLEARDREEDCEGRPRPVVIEVIDNGVGMDAETRRRCLEPFFTTKGERGTGLGLAMVYGTVQRHGGSIEVDSAPGQGTTVLLRFPVHAERPQAMDPTGSAPLDPGPLRILSIDDDTVLLASLVNALELDGHWVTACSGGAAGIKAFSAGLAEGEPFDVVISDLGMPHISGREVAAAVKKMSPDTPVVLLTGWGQHFAGLGPNPPNTDAVLSKPPRMPDLRIVLARLCGRAA